MATSPIPLPFHLHLLTLLLLFQEQYSIAISISSKSLVLPLTTQQQVARASSSLPKPANRLLFHHNVSLAVSLSVGTPPQNVSLVIDTGSELSWLRCTKNLSSLSSSSTFFFPSRSSSYSPVPCSSQICRAKTRDFPIPASCGAASLCHVILSYADASSSEGTLSSETFQLGSGRNSSRLSGTVFGCMDSMYSSNPEEDSKNVGLLGMNRGSLSFVSQMGFPRFSYCISSHESLGVLVLGEPDVPWLAPLNYTPLIDISLPLPYFDRVAYSVQLEGIRVRDKLLPLPKSVFMPDHTGAGQTMVDSGTQFTFLLGPVYTALRKEFVEQTRGLLKELEGYVYEGAMDLCFGGAVAKVAVERVPEVVLMFRGAELAVAGEGLLYGVSEGVFCFTFGNSDLVPMEAYVIGHHHQRDTWVEYDLENSRLGFGRVRCDWAGQRLGL